jgi:hypothetical protein
MGHAATRMVDLDIFAAVLGGNAHASFDDFGEYDTERYTRLSGGLYKQPPSAAGDRNNIQNRGEHCYDCVVLGVYISGNKVFTTRTGRNMGNCDNRGIVVHPDTEKNMFY